MSDLNPAPRLPRTRSVSKDHFGNERRASCQTAGASHPPATVYLHSTRWCAYSGSSFPAAPFGPVLTSEPRRLENLVADVHDGPLQMMLVLAQDLEDAGEEDLADARQLAWAAIRELRGIVSGLTFKDDVREHAESLLRDWCGVVSARRLCTWSLDVDPTVTRIPPVVVATARELITNTVKHSRCENFWVTIEPWGSGLRLTVADDGIGTVSDVRLGFGLLAVQRRVDTSHGTFRLERRPGGGTLAIIEFPDITE